MVATLFDCGYSESVSALLPADASNAADALFGSDHPLREAPSLLPNLLTTESMLDIAVHTAKKFAEQSSEAAVSLARSIVSTNAMSVLLKLDDEWFESLRKHLEGDDFSALAFCSGTVVNDKLAYFMTGKYSMDVPIACFRGLVGPKYGLQSPAITAPVKWTYKGVDMEPLYHPAQALVYMHLKLCAALEAAGETAELPLGARIAMQLLCAQKAAVKALPADLDCSAKGLELEDNEVWRCSHMRIKYWD